MKSDREITIRDYRPALDIEAAWKAFISGYGHSFRPAIEEAAPELIMDYMRGITIFGNQNLVADLNGEAVGILSGCVGMGPRRIFPGLIQNVFNFFPKLALNRYNASRKARKHIWLVLKNYLPFSFLKMPHSIPFCQVLLFTLRKEHRGKGVGRMMMDEYIRRVKAGGGNRIVLATDTTAGWRFYDNYGFKRIVSAPLHDCFSVALPGEEVTGYIYSLNLK